MTSGTSVPLGKPSKRSVELKAKKKVTNSGSWNVSPRVNWCTNRKSSPSGIFTAPITPDSPMKSRGLTNSGTSGVCVHGNKRKSIRSWASQVSGGRGVKDWLSIGDRLWLADRDCDWLVLGDCDIDCDRESEPEWLRLLLRLWLGDIDWLALRLRLGDIDRLALWLWDRDLDRDCDQLRLRDGDADAERLRLWLADIDALGLMDAEREALLLWLRETDRDGDCDIDRLPEPLRD